MSGVTAVAAATGVSTLLPLPVALPLLAAGVKLAIGQRLPRTQRFISAGVLCAVLGVSLALLIGADRDGPRVMHTGSWPATVGITLVADRLSGLMLVVSSAVTLCVLVYSIGQGMADRDEVTPLTVFHPAYLILVAGVCDTFLAGDLFNLYVGFEIMLTASYVLLTLGGTAARVRAGATYVVVSLLSSVLFLIAIGMVYGAAGTVNLALLAQRLGELPSGVRLLLQIALLTVFGIKAAVFPLAAWLPDSYPTAPAPVTAVFAGLLTKVGVYCMLRTQTLLFPGGRLADPLMVIALLSMLVGILGAVAQTDLKRLLSFTLVSHIGYMVFGIALASRGGLAGAVFYVAHHITVQTTLFLVAGLIERRGGTTDLLRLGGLARLSPLLAVIFFIPAMNLSGIPPLSGFLGKLGLLRAGIAYGGPWAYTLVAGGIVTSLLTLYALTKVWNLAFWRAAPSDEVEPGTVLESSEPDDGPGSPDDESAVPLPAGAPHTSSLSGRPITTTTAASPTMLGATCALVALGLSYTVLAGPLTGLADRAAAELLTRTPYVSAVLTPGSSLGSNIGKRISGLRYGEYEESRIAPEIFVCGARDLTGVKSRAPRIMCRIVGRPLRISPDRVGHTTEVAFLVPRTRPEISRIIH